jgi:NAD(P)-dependent dehydrogenase (short-subunit alcohol dehydrogenase family)
VLVARTPGGLEEVDDRVRARGGQATLVPFDLRDGAAIDRLGGVLAERYGRLDVLIGNAAELGALSPLGHVDPKIFERVMAINAGANYRLIRSLDPLLRAADAGRALFVTCAAARDARPFWGAYGASKAALEVLVLSYAAETRRSRLRVNLVDPGPMRSRLRSQAYPGEAPDKLPPPETRTDAFVTLAAPECARHGELISDD